MHTVELAKVLLSLYSRFVTFAPLFTIDYTLYYIQNVYFLRFYGPQQHYLCVHRRVWFNWFFKFSEVIRKPILQLNTKKFRIESRNQTFNLQ